jgi:ketosteroid isomerase-like protein
MGNSPEQHISQSPDETIKSTIRELHTAIEKKDILRMADLVVADVFVFGAAAEAISIGRDQFVTDLHSEFERVKEAQLRVLSPEIQVGLCDSGSSAWFLDRFVVNIVEDREIPRQIPIRVTGLLVRGSDWRLAAAFWSVPLRDNDYQYSLLEAGKIKSGVTLKDQVTPEAQPLAQSLAKVMTQPHSMPGLYSTHEDTFVIGSTVDEVFRGVEGKKWVQEIVNLPLKFAVRGGMRGAVTPDDQTAWVAAHIDLSGGFTVPYRFLYIWLREQDGWKIVLSHDAISIDPSNPGFEIP